MTTDAQDADGALATPPRANPDLIGHEKAERELLRLYQSGRLPHAILLSGPRGIGKATLAFRFARFVLAGPEGGSATTADSLAIDPQSGTFRRVAAGGHADLLTVERAYDPRRRRLRGEIIVDDAREIANFLRLTAAEGGWRVVVVDGAEEMNRTAANALLKILEEPPRRALLLLVSHSPGRLLPTIRSRCRRLPMSALPPPAVARLIEHHRPQLDSEDAAALAELSGGSIGRALDLASASGLVLYREMIGLLARTPELDIGKLYGFADRLVRGENEDAYRAVAELLPQLLARVAAMAAGRAIEVGVGAGQDGGTISGLAARAAPARWAALHREIGNRFARTDALNLDRKQAMLGAFFAIAEATG